jgi:phenylacetate-coenzyme A ligase PaaK-like adenylate-forming protein
MTGESPKPFDLERQIFTIENAEQFVDIALAVFRFQYQNNPVYRKFCDLLKKNPENVDAVPSIPFLPISFFKSHQVLSGQSSPELIFTSSGTTGSQTSRHFVASARLYQESFLTCFENAYGPVNEYCILGLLPSYLERQGSSLVYMVQELVARSGHPQSGFYLYEWEKLDSVLKQLEANGQKTMLFGVSYALLDFVERFPNYMQHTTIMETGGMKGRRAELSKAELYELLCKGFNVETIHAEYGMTELLSQAYGQNGVMKSPAWMQVLVRDETDPFTLHTNPGKSGGINVIDLANLYSCSFIETGDAGRLLAENSFEILGRLDHTDVRGCSLLLLNENGSS